MTESNLSIPPSAIDDLHLDQESLDAFTAPFCLDGDRAANDVRASPPAHSRSCRVPANGKRHTPWVPPEGAEQKPAPRVLRTILRICAA